ncbi:unnamed protein product, partial [Amoebophrya sp. A25]
GREAAASANRGSASGEEDASGHVRLETTANRYPGLDFSEKDEQNGYTCYLEDGPYRDPAEEQTGFRPDQELPWGYRRTEAGTLMRYCLLAGKCIEVADPVAPDESSHLKEDKSQDMEPLAFEYPGRPLMSTYATPVATSDSGMSLNYSGRPSTSSSSQKSENVGLPDGRRRSSTGGEPRQPGAPAASSQISRAGTTASAAHRATGNLASDPGAGMRDRLATLREGGGTAGVTQVLKASEMLKRMVESDEKAAREQTTTTATRIISSAEATSHGVAGGSQEKTTTTTTTRATTSAAAFSIDANGDRKTSQQKLVAEDTGQPTHPHGSNEEPSDNITTTTLSIDEELPEAGCSLRELANAIARLRGESMTYRNSIKLLSIFFTLNFSGAKDLTLDKSCIRFFSIQDQRLPVKSNSKGKKTKAKAKAKSKTQAKNQKKPAAQNQNSTTVEQGTAPSPSLQADSTKAADANPTETATPGEPVETSSAFLVGVPIIDLKALAGRTLDQLLGDIHLERQQEETGRARKKGQRSLSNILEVERLMRLRSLARTTRRRAADASHQAL